MRIRGHTKIFRIAIQILLEFIIYFIVLVSEVYIRYKIVKLIKFI